MRLSCVAQFLPVAVPNQLAVGPITDTVLGALHLATCDAAASRAPP